MGLVEHTGHGIPTILSKYGEQAFEIGDSFLNVTIPFDNDIAATIKNRENVGLNVGLNNTDKAIIRFLLETPEINTMELALKIGVTKRTVERSIRKLQNNHMITDLSGLACQLMRLSVKVQSIVSVPGDQCDFHAILLSVFENEKSRLSFCHISRLKEKIYLILLFDYSADWAETEYPDTESLHLESGKPSVFRPVRCSKKGLVAVQFRVKSEISRIASMKIDHFRTFFRARFLPKMADLRHR